LLIPKRVGQTRVDLYRHYASGRLSQTSGQCTQSGSNLEHVGVGIELGGAHDRRGHRLILEEGLGQAFGRPEPQGAKTRPRLAVHPLSIGAPPQPRARLLRPGTPAAPDEHSLLLLPSGSDRVRRSPPRRTRPSTLRCSLSDGQGTTSNGTSTPLERVSGYNGPLLRRLARPPRV